MRIVWDAVGFLATAGLAVWFFYCVINSLRTGQARPAFRQRPYTRRKHPRAFALTLLIWLAWGLVCLYPACMRAQAFVRAVFDVSGK